MVYLCQVVFMLGLRGDKDTDSSVKKEDAIFQDMVIADYMDSYQNLSYKALTAMHWLKTYCSTPQHVIHFDDNIVVNMFKLVSYLDVRLQKRANENIVDTNPAIGSFDCFDYVSTPVIRDDNSKWKVLEEQYPPTEYPPYCFGAAFIMDVEVAPLLLEASLRTTTFVWVDDCYLTGVLREVCGIPINSISNMYEWSNDGFIENLIAGDKMFLHDPSHNLKTIESMWTALLYREHQI